MTLEELAKLITAMRTSATHLGVKHSEAHITFNGDMEEITQLSIEGKIGSDGFVTLIVKV